MYKIEQAIEILMDEKGFEWCDRCEKWISKEAYTLHLNSEEHEEANQIVLT